MKNNPGAKVSGSKRAQPTVAGSLSEPAIRRQLLSDAVQHPATLLPLAVSTASAIYLVVLSPVLGRAPWAVGLLALSGLVAAASFVWLYMFRYTEEYARRAQELMELEDVEREQLEEAAMRQLGEALRGEFANGVPGEGMRALRGLTAEYEQLQPAMRGQYDADPLAMSRVPALVKETYRRGLGVLSNALELMKTAQTPSRESLERAIAALETEVEPAAGDQTQTERLKIKSDTLASHRQRLAMLDQLQLSVDRLLHQADRCEASLHRTRIELTAMRAGNSEASVDSVIELLQGTIHQAKEVGATQDRASVRAGLAPGRAYRGLTPRRAGAAGPRQRRAPAALRRRAGPATLHQAQRIPGRAPGTAPYSTRGADRGARQA